MLWYYCFKKWNIEIKSVFNKSTLKLTTFVTIDPRRYCQTWRVDSYEMDKAFAPRDEALFVLVTADSNSICPKVGQPAAL